MGHTGTLCWTLLGMTVTSLLEGVRGEWCRDSYSSRYCMSGCCGTYGRYRCCSYDNVYHAISWYYIVGGVVGGLAFLGTILALGYFYYRHRYRPRNVMVGPQTSTTTTSTAASSAGRGGAGLTVVHNTSTATPSYTQPQVPPYAPTAGPFASLAGYPYPAYPPPAYASVTFPNPAFATPAVSYTQASGFPPGIPFPPPYPGVGPGDKQGGYPPAGSY